MEKPVDTKAEIIALLEERAAEARTIIENVREIDATLRGLDQGRIKIQ